MSYFFIVFVHRRGILKLACYKFCPVVFITDSITALICPSRYRQICHLCKGEWANCGVSLEDGVTAQECVDFLDGTTIVAVHYNPSNEMCPKYVCEDTVYFDDSYGSQRWFMRYSTNPGKPF